MLRFYEIIPHSPTLITTAHLDTEFTFFIIKMLLWPKKLSGYSLQLVLNLPIIVF